ncbi:unnamed protein product [Vitrella brassicaformis CCMP3155]|uniref:G domain-containing protein n=1 Tax=Vitrella brassicaformis (strain CCMP3155) TaxID=1169540 RepID=A0A0G4H466_VITBC|nr:unnamed protein product [Vitrella brassicaformis CCMP3155]|eukprot:CEM38545.1 unnamed protein product [Vitrella brassicaformis CCMP3155]
MPCCSQNQRHTPGVQGSNSGSRVQGLGFRRLPKPGPSWSARVAVVGESGVGKSALLEAYLFGAPSGSSSGGREGHEGTATLQPRYAARRFPCGTVEFFDLPGLSVPSLRDGCLPLLERCDVIILVYDITRYPTYERLTTHWCNVIQSLSHRPSRTPPFVVVFANQIDRCMAPPGRSEATHPLPLPHSAVVMSVASTTEDCRSTSGEGPVSSNTSPSPFSAARPVRVREADHPHSLVEASRDGLRYLYERLSSYEMPTLAAAKATLAGQGEGASEGRGGAVDGASGSGRQVSTSQALKWTRQKGYPYFETSAFNVASVRLAVNDSLLTYFRQQEQAQTYRHGPSFAEWLSVLDSPEDRQCIGGAVPQMFAGDEQPMDELKGGGLFGAGRACCDVTQMPCVTQ